MMLLLTILFFLISVSLWFPFILLIISRIRKIRIKENEYLQFKPDYAIVVTAYQQTDFLDDAIQSILKNSYGIYKIYVVADACDISALNKYHDERVIILNPETVLASNTGSHFYAINHFKREHNIITIVDSDNIVKENYLEELNKFFQMGYQAVQGVREARNLNTVYAQLDEAGDIFYRYIDRKLLFEAGSSASLAGSGMAFKIELYKECLKKLKIHGAGFDKILQYEIVKRRRTIAFAEKAIVLDAKTTKSNQLVKQRARWINTWFKYWFLSIKLLFSSILNFDWNQFAFSLMLLRPPLFILAFVAIILSVVSIMINPAFMVLWVLVLIVFVNMFFSALNYFNTKKIIYLSLLQVPRFIFYQMIALVKVRAANKLSVATKHSSFYRRNKSIV